VKVVVCLTVAALAGQTNSISAGFFDAGSAAPEIGTNDIAELTSAAGGPPGLNYYVNNSAPPGQIFTRAIRPCSSAVIR